MHIIPEQDPQIPDKLNFTCSIQLQEFTDEEWEEFTSRREQQLEAALQKFHGRIIDDAVKSEILKVITEILK
jgi:hypothetical protein